MLLKKSHLVSKFSTAATSLKWRNQIKQNNLVFEISTILLQRKNWIPLLRKFNLSSNLTPNLFIDILHKTNNNAEISLHFFNWTKQKLGFKPDLKSYCKLIEILLQSNLREPAKPLLDDSLMKSNPISIVLDSMVKICRDSGSRSLVLSFFLENYSKKGLVFDGLEIFRRIRVYRYLPSLPACNALLDALCVADEMRLAWCFYSAVVRSGVVSDSLTWVLLVRVLCKEGKLVKAVRLLNSFISDVVVYNLIIDSYCKIGSFKVAVDLLNEMYGNNFEPGFSTYSSILDGACKFKDVGVIDSIMREMIDRGFLPKMPFSDYDFIIQKLCGMGKTYAVEFFFERSQDEMINLQDASYVCMLKAFSNEGRVKESMRVYRIILERKIAINVSCYNALVSVICKEEPSEEVNALLKDVIGKGFVPSSCDLSKYIAAQCTKGRFQEADDLLNAILEKGFLPDASCCCSLVKHYCTDGRADLAVVLHDKMEKLGGSLDVTSYNVLLDRLCMERRIEEATYIFDCMRRKNIVSSSSFSIMISTLCREKEMREAMKIHDEMVKKGLKPDEANYKRLISGFA
ncbi:tetratricopeptide repeat (TPR)-like superfamily protein [Tasmannia lanceolata]|uniref:tetratricopeptide repeat (TPR)-like superfamily protein n=1 Tax=Tasmannia lanceolata TaxID=3420 RepID=UPI004062AA2D